MINQKKKKIILIKHDWLITLRTNNFIIAMIDYIKKITSTKNLRRFQKVLIFDREDLWRLILNKWEILRKICMWKCTERQGSWMKSRAIVWSSSKQVSTHSSPFRSICIVWAYCMPPDNMVLRLRSLNALVFFIWF